MSESDWLLGGKPKVMLDFLLERSQAPAGSHGGRISLRKLRLFIAGSFRYLCGRNDPPISANQRHGIETLERFADDEDEGGLFKAWELSGLPKTGIAMATVAGTRMHARLVVNYPMEDMRLHQCFLLRDTVGNPWRPVAFDPAWRTPDVVSLAEAAYSERVEAKCAGCEGGVRTILIGEGEFKRIDYQSCLACHGTGKVATGTLDPFRLKLVADALEEVGVPNADRPNAVPSPHRKG